MSRKNVLEKGFVKASPQNLPVVTFDMFLEYLNNHDCFNGSEMRRVKTDRSTRANYGDNAIGWVQVARKNKQCFVKMKITPEHKTRHDLYPIKIIIDEENEVVEEAECTGCTAALGGCKHIAAALKWLNRRTEEPASTSEVCYWSRPVLARVGADLKIISISEIVEKTSGKKSSSNPEATINDFDFLKGVMDSMTNVSSFSRHFNPQSYSRPPFNLSMHLLACGYTGSKMDMRSFHQHVSNNLGPHECQLVERKTREQSQTTLWHELRYGRVTASILWAVAQCQMSDGSLVHQIMGGKIHETPAMARGKNLEEGVVKVVESFHQMKIRKSGLIIDPKYPIFGASPDGVSDTFVIEIKCPTNEKNFKKYYNNNTITPRYKAQIQLQMLLCNKKFGYFCVAYPDFETTGRVQIINEDYDEPWLKDIMRRAQDFWEQNIFPLMMRVPRDV